MGYMKPKERGEEGHIFYREKRVFGYRKAV
jgi:hypothetical protein